MFEDFYPAAEKILSDIVQLIQKDPKLSTVEVIPTTTCTNKSPVHHEQHSLGLESWCIQPVYCHAYQCIMNMRQTKARCRDVNRLNSLLVGVLMINPNVTTFWNMRKELISWGKLDPYFELHFSALVLSRKPKTPDIYTHRKWVLNKIWKGYNDKSGLLNDEMEVSEAAANRYSNNYHAWTHRLWCLNQGLPLQDSRPHFLLQELNWSQSWILTHVSDHSGLHYRQQLVSLLGDSLVDKTPDFLTSIIPSNQFQSSQIESAFSRFCTTQRIVSTLNVPCVFKLIIFELVFNTEMINDFVAHEALWYHRRFVFHFFKSHFPPARDSEANRSWPDFLPEVSHSNGDGVPSVKTQKIESLGFNLFSELLAYEASFLKQYNVDKTDHISKKYAARHEQWLATNFKLRELGVS